MDNFSIQEFYLAHPVLNVIQITGALTLYAVIWMIIKNAGTAMDHPLASTSYAMECL
jgi:hypothetical protein